jgi:hypothetical protein
MGYLLYLRRTGLDEMQEQKSLVELLVVAKKQREDSSLSWVELGVANSPPNFGSGLLRTTL